MSNAFYTEMMEYSRGLTCISDRYIHQGNQRWKYFDKMDIENYQTYYRLRIIHIY